MKFPDHRPHFIKLNRFVLALSPRLAALTIATVAVTIAALSAVTWYFSNQKSSPASTSGIDLACATCPKSDAPLPLQPFIYFNPINGVLLSQDQSLALQQRHPVAVTVNNHTSARPQHGLMAADVMFEVLAEGGITRYVPVFYQNSDVPKIGPVRSLRYYMIEYASGYSDAIILYHGWAGFSGAPGERYNEKTDAITAVSKFKIKSIATAASTYRDSEKAKKDGYVHSLYTDSQRINSETERLSKAFAWNIGGAGPEALAFKSAELYNKRGDFTNAKVQFSGLAGSGYVAEFFYDKPTNKYLRKIGGKEDIDLNTSEQIAVDNVIIETHNYYSANDGYARIVVDMIDEGKVVILRDGLIVDGVWKKTCRTCRTKYFDLDGNEIELNRGKIWIMAAIKTGNNQISKVEFNY